MENAPAIFTLAVLVVMIIAFASGKFSFGLIAISIPVVLQASGILEAKEAWAGFSNTGVIVMIPLFILAATLKKSSFMFHMKRFATKLAHTRGGKLKVLGAFGLSTFLLANFLNTSATIAILIPLVAVSADTIDEDRRSMTKWCTDIASCSRQSLPIGKSLTSFVTANAILEAAGAEQRFGMFDHILMKLPMSAVWTIVMIVIGYHFYNISFKNPDPYVQEVSFSAKDGGKDRGTTLSPAMDRLAYILFFGGMALMIFGTLFTSIPILVWAFIPALIALFSGILTGKEAIGSMIWTSILLTAGTLPLTSAITATGADVYLSKMVSFILMGHTSLFAVTLVFFLVPLVCTQLISDTATMNIFRALGVSSAVALGIDPRPVMLAAQTAASLSMATPMGGAQNAMTFGTGGFTMKEYLRTSLPALALMVVIFVIWMPIFFTLLK